MSQRAVTKHLTPAQRKAAEERIKQRKINISNRNSGKKSSFAQVARKNINKNYTNLLKIRNAFLELLAKRKVLDIHNAAIGENTSTYKTPERKKNQYYNQGTI